MLTFAKSRNMLLCSTFVNVRSLKQQIFQIKWSYCTLVSVLGAENTTVNKTYPLISLIVHTSKKRSKDNTLWSTSTRMHWVFTHWGHWDTPHEDWKMMPGVKTEGWVKVHHVKMVWEGKIVSGRRTSIWKGQEVRKIGQIREPEVVWCT